jgi:glutathione reductase (NADPH)
MPVASTGRRSKQSCTTELDRLEGIYRSLLKNSGVDTYDSRAILGPHTVELASGETSRAKHILVATGGRPVQAPNCPGSSTASPRTIFSTWKSCRNRILIIGGGYIACEFACILNGLGVQVSSITAARRSCAASTTRRAATSAEMIQSRHRPACRHRYPGDGTG